MKQRPLFHIIILIVSLWVCPMVYGAEDQVEEETTPKKTVPPPVETERECLFPGIVSGQTLYAKDTRHRRPEKAKDFADEFTFRLSSYVTSQYVSFGQPFSKGAVWQPSGSIEFHGVGFNVWANFVLDSEPNQGEFNEVDLTLYYNAEIGNLTIHPFMLVIFYPNADPASLDYSDTEGIEPSFHLAYSMGPIDAFMDATLYLQPRAGRFKMKTGLGYRDVVSDGLWIDTFVLLGLANGRYNETPTTDPGARINYFEYSFGLVWHPLGKEFAVKPNIQLTTLLPEALKKTADDPTIIWGGIEFVYRF